ncbi:hypothetical protein [Vibrio sp. SCSIO 43137]|uniref:hypothetical protein n=1 Tax=Vibrio sp. SCSIO 43137 TaxID=3021011 RepID=UPI002306F12B|nr:hypothetical protein [Vibrio sp. SCSIO 43137]WCE28349.1 hypothetical protein PK654_08120 [Vibrio sp. SCSIO 43137]
MMKLLLTIIITFTSLAISFSSMSRSQSTFMGCYWDIPYDFERLNDDTYFSLSKHSKIYFDRGSDLTQLKSIYSDAKVLEDYTEQGFRFQRLSGKGELSYIKFLYLVRDNFDKEILTISIRDGDILVSELSESSIELVAENKDYKITASCDLE